MKLVKLPQQSPTPHTPSINLETNQGLGALLNSASHVVISRSTVVYDGERTYVDAEERELSEGRWEQRRVEGVWEGDQSREIVTHLTRARSAVVHRATTAQRIAQPPRTRSSLPRGPRGAK